MCVATQTSKPPTGLTVEEKTALLVIAASLVSDPDVLHVVDGCEACARQQHTSCPGGHVSGRMFYCCCSYGFPI